MLNQVTVQVFKLAKYTFGESHFGESHLWRNTPLAKHNLWRNTTCFANSLLAKQDSISSTSFLAKHILFRQDLCFVHMSVTSNIVTSKVFISYNFTETLIMVCSSAVTDIINHHQQKSSNRNYIIVVHT